MANRTFAIGDIHGDIGHLRLLLRKFPALDAEDTVVFVGDYLDRGPDSLGVIEHVRAMEQASGCRVVCLRGNHEDAWLRVIDHTWPEFVMPVNNGCLATLRSFAGGAVAGEDEIASQDEVDALYSGSFFPPDVVEWMRGLPYWYEDEHAIYVHAGLIERNGVWPHPRDTEPMVALLWTRTESFFREYRGKRVVIGHTHTELLPQELSSFTPDDPSDLWAGESVIALDTGCGKGGFLTAIELPALHVYESRLKE